LGVIQNERTELTAGVAARPEHSDRDSIHSECIIMRTACVNAE
jgi:hypothetical protein